MESKAAEGWVEVDEEFEKGSYFDEEIGANVTLCVGNVSSDARSGTLDATESSHTLSGALSLRTRAYDGCAMWICARE